MPGLLSPWSTRLLTSFLATLMDLARASCIRFSSVQFRPVPALSTPSLLRPAQPSPAQSDPILDNFELN